MNSDCIYLENKIEITWQTLKKRTQTEIAAATDSQVENYEDFFQASLTSFIPSLIFPRQL